MWVGVLDLGVRCLIFRVGGDYLDKVLAGRVILG